MNLLKLTTTCLLAAMLVAGCGSGITPHGDAGHRIDATVTGIKLLVGKKIVKTTAGDFVASVDQWVIAGRTYTILYEETWDGNRVITEMRGK